MNLNQLRFVAAVAAERSFSRAAERCHVTQPTLSSGVALLEEELGGQLFVRTTRRVDLSPFGERLLPLIDGVLHSQAELEAGVRAFYDPTHKVARIGFSPLVDMRLLTEVLAPYRAEHPGTETFFKECFLGDLDERLRAGQIDLVVRPRIAGDRTRKSLVHATFYEEDLYYLPRQGHGESPRGVGAVSLRDVAGETFVLCAEGCGLAWTTRRLFADVGASLHEYPGQALSFQVMQEWADIGIGATILPESKITAPLRPRARRLLGKGGKPARVTFEAAWRKGAAYPRHVADLHRHFRQRVPKLVGGSAPRRAA